MPWSFVGLSEKAKCGVHNIAITTIKEEITILGHLPFLEFILHLLGYMEIFLTVGFWFTFGLERAPKGRKTLLLEASRWHLLEISLHKAPKKVRGHVVRLIGDRRKPKI